MSGIPARQTRRLTRIQVASRFEVFHVSQMRIPWSLHAVECGGTERFSALGPMARDHPRLHRQDNLEPGCSWSASAACGRESAHQPRLRKGSLRGVHKHTESRHGFRGSAIALEDLRKMAGETLSMFPSANTRAVCLQKRRGSAENAHATLATTAATLGVEVCGVVQSGSVAQTLPSLPGGIVPSPARESGQAVRHPNLTSHPAALHHKKEQNGSQPTIDRWQAIRRCRGDISGLNNTVIGLASVPSCCPNFTGTT